MQEENKKESKMENYHSILILKEFFREFTLVKQEIEKKNKIKYTNGEIISYLIRFYNQNKKK